MIVENPKITINMKRALMIIAAVACFCACTEKEPAAETFETSIMKLYGNYHLSDIHWPGLPVNLNKDEYAYWALLNEFKNMPGYYEPDYIATVGEGIIYKAEEEWAEYAAGFNVTIPYPMYDIVDGKWVCSEISTIRMTIRATEETFKVNENCCWTYPGQEGSKDPFLQNITNFSLYVESMDDDSFQIGILCVLPYDDSNGFQKREDNYLYYTFTRK